MARLGQIVSILTLWAFFSGLPAGLAQADLSSADLTYDEVLHAAQQQLEADPKVEVLEITKDGGLKVSVEGREPTQVFFDNVLRTLRNAEASERPAVLSEFLDSLLAPPGASGAALAEAVRLDTLMISLYDAQYIENWRALIADNEDTAGKASSELFMQHLAGDLYLGYVFDTPKSVRVASLGDLETLGISQSEAEAKAREHLEAYVQDLQVFGNGDIYYLELDGYYENATLALDWLWQRLADQLEVTPLVATPARGHVYFVDATDLDAVKSLAELSVQLFSSEPHPISHQLFLWQEDHWRAIGG